MEIGDNRPARLSKPRLYALIFFLGMLIGVLLGYWIGSDDVTVRVRELDPPEAAP